LTIARSGVFPGFCATKQAGAPDNVSGTRTKPDYDSPRTCFRRFCRRNRPARPHMSERLGLARGLSGCTAWAGRAGGTSPGGKRLDPLRPFASGATVTLCGSRAVPAS
jgi:hypothetical protein